MAVSLSADALGLPESLWSSKERKAARKLATGQLRYYGNPRLIVEPHTGRSVWRRPCHPKPLRSGESIGTLAFISSTLSDAVTTKSRPPSSRPEASTGRRASPTQAGSLSAQPALRRQTHRRIRPRPHAAVASDVKGEPPRQLMPSVCYRSEVELQTCGYGACSSSDTETNVSHEGDTRGSCRLWRLPVLGWVCAA